MALKNGSWWDGDTQPIERPATQPQVTREAIIAQYAAVASAEETMNRLSAKVEAKPFFTIVDQSELAEAIDRLGRAETDFLKFMRQVWTALPDEKK